MITTAHWKYKPAPRDDDDVILLPVVRWTAAVVVSSVGSSDVKLFSVMIIVDVISCIGYSVCRPVSKSVLSAFGLLRRYWLSHAAKPCTFRQISAIGSPLSSSITPSLFHSALKTLLCCKYFLRSLPFLLPDWLHGFPGLFTDISVFYLLVFFLFSTF